MTTICENCKNIIHGELPDSPRYEAWYNLRCGARQRKPALDVVTGRMGFAGENDLGGKYVSHEPRPYCRDVNDGWCDLFKEA